MADRCIVWCSIFEHIERLKVVYFTRSRKTGKLTTSNSLTRTRTLARKRLSGHVTLSYPRVYSKDAL